ncbi:MAG: hypothetical protein MJY58_07445, partial [Bacteroidaceae bacterium]|nr:hypothetical protein [Bacteroidaceae bacterium]
IGPAQVTMEYLSQERYNEISAELDNLINVEFPKIKDAISEARAQAAIPLWKDGVQNFGL